MPQPKKKTSASKQGHTRSHWKAKLPNVQECPRCHSPKLSHHVCKTCGYYNNLKVINPA